MTTQDNLRDAIDRERERLRRCIPAGGRSATLAILRAINQSPDPSSRSLPDLITGRHIPSLGANRALQLVVEELAGTATVNNLDAWAQRFLDECTRLAEA